MIKSLITRTVEPKEICDLLGLKEVDERKSLKDIKDHPLIAKYLNGHPLSI